MAALVAAVLLTGCGAMTSGLPGGESNAAESKALEVLARDLDAQMRPVAGMQGRSFDADVVASSLGAYPSSGSGWTVGNAAVTRSGDAFEFTAGSEALCYTPGDESSAYVPGPC